MKRTIATALLSLAVVGCDSAEEGEFTGPDRAELAAEIEESTEDLDLRDDGLEPVDAIEVTQVEIARIEIDSGEVVFHVAADGPAAGQLTMTETLWPDEDGMVTPRVGDRSPLQAFLALTDEEVPVPVALVESEDDEAALTAAAQREHTDLISDPISARPRDLLASAPEAWSAVFMCSEGTTSGQFLDEICSRDSDWNRRYCHNGSWSSVTDTSGSLRVDWSRSRTLACQVNGRVRHYYKAGLWYKEKDHTVPLHNVSTITAKNGAFPYLRKITHNSVLAGYGIGFVRGYSTFRRFPF